MGNGFLEMTEKMKTLFMDIIASLGQLPDEIKGYLFGEGDETDLVWVSDVASYITLEYIKYAFDKQDPEHPIRYFIDKDDDSERMVHSRTMKYVLKYKMREISESGVTLPSNHKYADVNLDSIEKRIKGHRLTEMNYFEHNNIHNLELIKAIVEKRIVSSKKVSNTKFQEMFEQYDEMVCGLMDRAKQSDEDMVFASLAFYTFEWHYPMEMFYYIAGMVEEKNVQTIDPDLLLLLCSRVNLESRFGGKVETESRMVKERLPLIDYLLNSNVDSHNKQILIDMIKEIIVLCANYAECVATVEGEPYKEWFRRESDIKDWASFFRWYGIFDIWEKKKWNRKRIQIMRKLIQDTFR